MKFEKMWFVNGIGKKINMTCKLFLKISECDLQITFENE